ncbi:ATP-binding protein [Nocardiopsis sp. CNR-923]|uniref:ATP-binding protein n=1 Tax=Nocardiopsis sp. CNR-923 TaxID=1904965 RepID=UPI0021CCE751|nr:ATP-binding protein [Nocardiopsis sp. CNR-923]
MAELLENAAGFSPPGTPVTVRGRDRGDGGCVVEVEDRGLGMTRVQRVAANALLADPPRFDLARMREDSHLGLFVAATIAARHGFGVTLRTGAYAGTRAVVEIPVAVLAEPRDGGRVVGGAGLARARWRAGRRLGPCEARRGVGGRAPGRAGGRRGGGHLHGVAEAAAVAGGGPRWCGRGRGGAGGRRDPRGRGGRRGR